MRMYGLSGALKQLNDAIQTLETKRAELTANGCYEVGYATQDEARAVERAEERFLDVLRERLAEPKEEEVDKDVSS